MNLYDITLDAMYKIQAGQMEKRSLCRVCRYDGGELSCTAEVQQCPAVLAQVNILKAGLWGIEQKQEEWLKDDF